jgi:hypothetical protein
MKVQCVWTWIGRKHSPPFHTKGSWISSRNWNWNMACFRLILVFPKKSCSVLLHNLSASCVLLLSKFQAHIWKSFWSIFLKLCESVLIIQPRITEFVDFVRRPNLWATDSFTSLIHSHIIREKSSFAMTLTYVLNYLLRGLSPQANCTDRVTAACRRS